MTSHEHAVLLAKLVRKDATRGEDVIIEKKKKQMTKKIECGCTNTTNQIRSGTELERKVIELIKLHLERNLSAFCCSDSSRRSSSRRST